MALTEKQFQERTIQLLAKEWTEPERWWYMSFADGKFLGGVIVLANGPVSARMQLPLLGIQSPGGEVMFMPIPAEAMPPEKYRNRLLSRAEIQEFWPDAKTIREHGEEQTKAK